MELVFFLTNNDRGDLLNDKILVEKKGFEIEKCKNACRP